jgi:hypothetical protein
MRVNDHNDRPTNLSLALFGIVTLDNLIPHGMAFWGLQVWHVQHPPGLRRALCLRTLSLFGFLILNQPLAFRDGYSWEAFRRGKAWILLHLVFRGAWLAF